MKYIDIVFEMFINATLRMFDIFRIDDFKITDEHIDYYKNYYLKEIPHKDFTTDGN